MKLLGVFRARGGASSDIRASAPARGANVIRTADLTKTYAADGVEVHALQGVSPDVEAGFTGSQMEDFFRFVEASGTSILDASRVAGVTIPALCYHPVFMGGPRPPG